MEVVAAPGARKPFANPQGAAQNSAPHTLVNASRPVRILFITATRIGDAVLSTGLLAHLLARHPGARITVACGPAAVGVFERMPGLVATLIVQKRRADLHWLALWARTVGTLWDLVVDLRGSALSLVLPARRRAIGRGGRRPGHRLGQLGAVLHLQPPPQPVAWFGKVERDRATALLSPERRWIGLGPTANWDGKIWPAQRFVTLAAALQDRLPNAGVALFGGPGEQERARAAPVLAALPGAVDLCGRLSLSEAAACLARCALFVGNDSGLMHLAAAAGAPTLGLFGPSPAAEYAPIGRCAAFVEADGPPGEAPIAALPVERVLAAATALLERCG